MLYPSDSPNPGKPVKIPPDSRRGFRPSLQVRASYPGARHAPLTAGGQTYPGLFSIHAFGRDTALFVVVVILELLGLWLLVYGYWDSNGIRGLGDQGAWMPFSLAIAAFILDLLAAIFHHWPYKTRLNCFENRKKFPRSQRKSDGERTHLIDTELQWRHYLKREYNIGFYQAISWFCIAVILGLAIIKMLAINMFLPSAIGDNLRPPITVSYLVCGFLHIFVTGYFLSGLITKWGFPPFLPIFQKGEMQEKALHLSYASQAYVPKEPYPTENFLPFECLMDGESPFEIRPTEVKDDPEIKQQDSAYHVLYVESRDLPQNHLDILSHYKLDAGALDRPLREIALNPTEWADLLSRLGAFPTNFIDIRPDTVTVALEHAKNATLKSLLDRSYIILMYGLLRDEHLSRFISDQPDSAKPTVMRWAHYAQYQQLLKDD